MTSLEALEAYSSAHPETIDELLEWPARRFTKAFGAWQRRNAVDELEIRKNMHVYALYANTNWDDEKNDRERAVEAIENSYEIQKDIIWKSKEEIEKEHKEMQEAQKADPFLRAGKFSAKAYHPFPEIEGEGDEEYVEESPGEWEGLKEL